MNTAKLDSALIADTLRTGTKQTELVEILRDETGSTIDVILATTS